MLRVVDLGHDRHHIPLGGIWSSALPVTLYRDVTSAEHPARPLRHRDVRGGPARLRGLHPRGRHDQPADRGADDRTAGDAGRSRRRAGQPPPSGPGEWTVSSELSLEVDPDAAGRHRPAPDVPVVGDGATVRRERATWRSRCANSPIAGPHWPRPQCARSTSSTPGRPHAASPKGRRGPLPPGALSDRMAVRVAGERRRGHGPSAAGRSGAEQQPRHRARRRVGDGARSWSRRRRSTPGSGDRPLRTASLRVNFIRQFRSSPESHYVGTALRVGRSSGIGDAQAIGPDGKVAIIARLTAYR